MTELHNKALNILLNKIKATSAPINVIINPPAEAEEKNCFNNVLRHVDKFGGKIIYGWALAVSQFLVEAEKHAIWKKPDGTLIDLTPRIPAITSLWFVEDPKFEYKGQYVDNVRVNATTNSVVDDWIKICENMEVLFTLGTRQNEHEISVPVDLEPLLKHLEDLKVKYERYLYNGGHEKAVCFCGRSIPYHNCHGADLVNIEKTVKAKQAKYLSA